MEPLKCLIIGAGPAGYTAAVYAARANLNPVLYTGCEPGGQLMLTTDVENYLGYPEGIKGPQMMQDFQKQAERFGTVIHYEEIIKVDFSSPIHKVWTSQNQLINTHTVIVATGAIAKWLGLESEQRLMNKGVSACAVCDGFFFKGQAVGVVGGGDSAAEEALYLAKLCPTVHLFIRRDQMRASKIMAMRVKKMSNIQIHWNSQPHKILGKNRVEGVEIMDTQTQSLRTVPLTGFFVAIGHKPNTQIFENWLDMDQDGYLKTLPNSSKTNIAGVFASGDVQDRIYRQAITAAGTGCMAALDAERYLTNHGLV